MAQTNTPTTSAYHTRVARLARWRSPDDPELLLARQELCVAKVSRYLRRAFATAPSLTAEQRRQLTDLIDAGDGADAA